MPSAGEASRPKRGTSEGVFEPTGRYGVGADPVVAERHNDRGEAHERLDDVHLEADGQVEDVGPRDEGLDAGRGDRVDEWTADSLSVAHRGQRGTDGDRERVVLE